MTDDRRRFFRINDTLGVSYRVITQKDLDSQTPLGADQMIEAAGLITGYDRKIDVLLNELRATQPLVAELLETMNYKLNGVVAQLQLDSDLVQRIAHKVQEVNISACGMAFGAETAYENGTMMAMDMILLPNNTHILTRAVVVGCKPSESGAGFHVRVEFTDIGHHDQETLIQHIVRRQVTLIRVMRDNEQKGGAWE